MKFQAIKQNLSRVFDDNLRTEQWQNWGDYLILSLILLSTLEIFLSTYDGIAQEYWLLLHIIDWITTIFFAIKVSLRIWCADLLDEKRKVHSKLSPIPIKFSSI